MVLLAANVPSVVPLVLMQTIARKQAYEMNAWLHFAFCQDQDAPQRQRKSKQDFNDGKVFTKRFGKDLERCRFAQISVNTFIRRSECDNLVRTLQHHKVNGSLFCIHILLTNCSLCTSYTCPWYAKDRLVSGRKHMS